MKKLLGLCTLLLLLMAVSPICYAQFDIGGGDQAAPPVPPWTLFHLSPSVKIKLDFRNASVDAVIATLSKASGVAIVKDPAYTGVITLQSPKPQSLDDAFAMFNAVLTLQRATLTKSGNFLLITAGQQNSGRFGQGGGNPFAAFQNAGGQNPFGSRGGASQSVLQVYTLKYISSSNLATTINNLFTATPTNNANNPFAAAIQGALGGAGAGAPGGGRGGRGGANALSGGVSGDVVKASSDDFSNSLIVNAPQRDQDEIAQIITEIDHPSSQPQTSEVFKLRYALASDMQTVVQNILTNTQTTGRGSTTSTTGNNNRGGGGGGGFGGFGGFGNRGGGSGNTNANGSVSADTRTNSIVVTSTQTLLDQVSKVVDTLDVEATYESSTFVYSLKNARCDIVANLFNEALGNRTTNGPTGGSLSNQISQTSTTSSSTSGAPSLGTTSRGGTTTSNQTVTASTTNTPQTYGLGEGGNIVNIRNLTGYVLLVPMPDTNSIIVSAPPEDQPLVKSLLQEMDQIPQQVMINVLVVEVSLDKSDQFGIEYSTPANHGVFSQIFGLGSGFAATEAATPTAGTLGPSEGLVYTLTSGQYSAFLQAAATDTKLDVLSTPRIFTTNNATAQINVSESVPYLTGTSSTAGTFSNSYDFLDVGLVLTVTPRIMSSGYVTMDVSQTDNSIQTFLDGGTEPEVNQRQAETTVSVMDGRTICLGGIIQNQINSTVNKVPVLGDIPLLGDLFKSTSKTKAKDELLVFLTPHVITTPDDAQLVKDANVAELDTEARAMMPKTGLNPDAPLPTPNVPQPTTTVTVTPNVQTTPGVAVGPTGATVAPAPSVAVPAAAPQSVTGTAVPSSSTVTATPAVAAAAAS